MNALPGYVYVASSWRNPCHPNVVDSLRMEGFPCYDFKRDEGAQFGWHEVMPDTYVRGSQTMAVGDYLDAIEHPRSIAGYASDFAAMERADTFVLVLPCGRSAHLELGWAVGAGKRTAILLDASQDVMVPELMYKMVDHLAANIDDLLAWLGTGCALSPCPECTAGKCRNCSGFTWDNAADHEDTCPCAGAGHGEAGEPS